MEINTNNEMSFWEHLEKLRWVIIRSLIGICILSIIAYIYSDFLFENIFLSPKEPYFITKKILCNLSQSLKTSAFCLEQSSFKIINIKLAGQFTTDILISLALGVFTASPYIIFEFWNFVRPALQKKEKKHSRGAVVMCSFLFITGVLFSYFIILPITISFLGSYQINENIENTISLQSYIMNIISVTLSVGILFEIPVFVFFLTKTSIITPEYMKRNRKIVFVILLALSAIITPPDIFTMIIIVIPLTILYESSIIISEIAYRKISMQ